MTAVEWPRWAQSETSGFALVGDPTWRYRAESGLPALKQKMQESSLDHAEKFQLMAGSSISVDVSRMRIFGATRPRR
ncbi:hypothetical protein ACRBEV_27140 [Methylobacterium phyllosphaerae]